MNTSTLFRPIEWARIGDHVDTDTDIVDTRGVTWRRTSGRTRPYTLYRYVDDATEPELWLPGPDDMVRLPLPPIAEPPDGTRIEFVHHTDRFAAWRDDASSADAGWSAGDGGDVWCLYGHSVPMSWLEMWLHFGDSLCGAVRLVPGDAR